MLQKHSKVSSHQLEVVTAKDVKRGDLIKCDDNELRTVLEVNRQLGFSYIGFTVDYRLFAHDNDKITRVRK